jgi:DNA gyrase subunit B
MVTSETSSKTSSKTSSNYSADNLQLVEGLDHVRKRPGMYIGSTGLGGLHHLIYEIVDNSVDEAMAGHCDRIEVEVTDDQWVTVRDNGRGIPVDIHKDTGLSGLDLVLTKIGGGGKWNAEDGGYKVSGGLHGVGSSVVNAVSREMRAVVHREGYEWTRIYKNGGKPQGQVKKGAKVQDTGTTISWLYDDQIFEKGIKYDRETVERRLKELAYLNPGLTFVLRFHGHKDATFIAEGGLSDYMKHLVAERDGVASSHKAPILFNGEVTEDLVTDGKTRSDTTNIDLALFWTDAATESAYSFVNSINTKEGGTHLSGVNAALRKALNEAGQELGKFRAKDEPFNQEDTREGLFYAVSAKVSEPQFEGQTKMKLGNPEVGRRVDAYVTRELKNWLLAKDNKNEAERILDRVIESRDGRLAAKKAKDAVSSRKGLLGGSGLPGKLADCISKDIDKTEIFIVEGDSAGGGMKQTRDRYTQAVLPLKGKVLNSEKAGDKALGAEGIQVLLSALGGAVTPVQIETKRGSKIIKKTKLVVDLSEPRYGKIVLCTDADVDGGHIVTLLLTFFFRFAPSVIRDGRLFIAELPLYRVEHKRQGRLYLYTDEELETLIKSGQLKTRTDGTINVQRFKGLGEMMPAQLEELALNRETRKLRRVILDDVAEAEDMTTLLMGSRVDRRREYIEEHALDVEVDV